MVTPVNGNKLAVLQKLFSAQGMSTVKVVPPGAVRGMTGVESLKRLPNLYQELSVLIKNKFGIEVTEIFFDREAKLEILGCNPPFIERVRNANGNLAVLGHTVVFEMEGEQGGKLFLMSNPENIVKADAAPRLNIEEIDWPQRMYDSEAKSIPANILFEPSGFASLSLPDGPQDKLLFLFSALELWKAGGGNPPLARNHILTEMKNLYQSITDPSQKQNLADIGITCALQLLERDRSDQWAGIISLAAIPIPAEHPKLPEISRKLAQIITASEHWPNVKAAAEVALKIKDSFPSPARALIKSATEQMAPVYAKSALSYGIDMMFDAQRQTGDIAALLDKIIKEFSLPAEAAKGFDRSVLEKSFQPPEVRPKVEEIYWLENMRQARIEPPDKLPLFFSALGLWNAGGWNPPLEENSILVEIRSLYQSITDPAEKQNLVEIGLTRALQLMEGNGFGQWAGITALAGIPIPPGHPKLPEIGGLLAQIIKRAPSNDLPAAITKAAAETSLAIKDLLSENEKALIRDAALNMASFYILLSNDYTRAKLLEPANESQSIAALLASIIRGFAPSPETKKELDRSVLEKTFELTTFNDKGRRNENVTASVAQVLNPDEFQKLLSKDYPDQRLGTIYEALSSLADAIGSIPPKAEIDHIFAEMRAIFRKKNPSFIPAGMGSAKYYLSHNDKFKRWTGAAILGNILVASDSRAAAEIIRMIEAFGQTENCRFVIDELIAAASIIRDKSKPGTEINDQATRAINIMRARLDGGGLL